MADIIATEAQAASIGGGSSYTANLMVTRVRAVALGCSISGSYSDNQLVCLKDLYKASSCSCQYNCNCNSVCTCNSTCSCTATCNCNLETTYTGACTCTSVQEKGTCTCYIACSPYCLSDHTPGYSCNWDTPSPPGSCTPGYCYCNSADSCSYYSSSCSGYEACVQVCITNQYCYIDQQCTCNTVSRYCTSQCNCTSYCNCQSECTGDGTGSSWGCTCQYVG